MRTRHIRALLQRLPADISSALAITGL